MTWPLGLLLLCCCTSLLALGLLQLARARHRQDMRRLRRAERGKV